MPTKVGGGSASRPCRVIRIGFWYLRRGKPYRMKMLNSWPTALLIMRVSSAAAEKGLTLNRNPNLLSNIIEGADLFVIVMPPFSEPEPGGFADSSQGLSESDTPGGSENVLSEP